MKAQRNRLPVLDACRGTETAGVAGGVAPTAVQGAGHPPGQPDQGRKGDETQRLAKLGQPGHDNDKHDQHKQKLVETTANVCLGYGNEQGIRHGGHSGKNLYGS